VMQHAKENRASAAAGRVANKDRPGIAP
jgi:hypothetical protein